MVTWYYWLMTTPPRGAWPLGGVSEVNSREDGLVPSARLVTKSGQLVRPITKVVILENNRFESFIQSEEYDCFFVAIFREIDYCFRLLCAIFCNRLQSQVDICKCILFPSKTNVSIRDRRLFVHICAKTTHELVFNMLSSTVMVCDAVWNTYRSFICVCEHGCTLRTCH